MSPENLPIFAAGYCVVSVVIVTGLILWYYHQGRLEREKIAREQWSETRGLIVDTQKRKITIRSGAIAVAHVYRLKLQFVYDVRNIDYKGSKTIATESVPEIEQYCRRYTNGSGVKVLYNPKKPKDIVIDIGDKLIL